MGGVLVLVSHGLEYFSPHLYKACYETYPVKMYNSVVFNIVTELCNHHLTVYFRTFLSPSHKETPLAVSLPLSPPNPASVLGNHKSTFCVQSDILRAQCTVPSL